MLREEHILHDAEQRLRQPVDRQAERDDKAEPDGHERHEDIHHLAGLGRLGGGFVLFAVGVGDNGAVHLLADEHRQIVQAAGEQRDDKAADIAPALGLPDLPARDLAEVDAEEGKIDGRDAHDGFAHGGVGELQGIFLQIGSRAILPVVAELADLNALLRGHDGLEGIDGLRVQVHQVVQRFTDDSVQRQKEQQRQERPQAAAVHADALGLIEGHDLLLIFLLVVSAGKLQLLELRLQAGHLHHALLALGAERQKDQLDNEREQNERKAVVIQESIEEFQHIAKGNADKIHERPPLGRARRPDGTGGRRSAG